MATTNGGAVSQTVDGAHGDLSQVLHALQAIYDPQSTNATRRQATEYLESAKQHPDAPAHGRSLALDKSQPAQLRHYGLTMLEHSITYRWEDFTVDQSEALRACVFELATTITEDDPVYLRNKVAHLWTEIAKRAWGAEWMNMDEQLVQLWQTSLHHQAVVLYVLETLSEEIFNREDPTAGLRGSVLGRACVEVFTSATVLSDQLPTRDKNLGVRFGEEGWLQRLSDSLNWTLSQDFQNEDRLRTSAVKTMNALRATMPWVIPKAITSAQVIECTCAALATPVVEIQLAAVDILQAICRRHHLSDDDILDLIGPLLSDDRIHFLRQVYDWTVSDMDVHNLNEQKYTLCKKLAELSHSLGLFIDRQPRDGEKPFDISGYLNLVYQIALNDSLFVSIPAIHCWTKLLRLRFMRNDPQAPQIMMKLLELCFARLIRYEAFPEDSDNVTILFLNEDVDTVPERHAFLGNYRRYCVEIVEIIVRKQPVEAMSLILTQASTMFHNLYQDQPPFQPQTFSKSSMPVLRVDAHVTIIDAGLKGFLKWLVGHGREPLEQQEAMRNNMEESFEQWCRQLLQIRFEDPEITKKIVHLIANFSTKVLPDRAQFALAFLEYLLTIKLADNTALPQYSDAVKELERVCSSEIQKLAMKFPDDFMNVYEGLERRINEMLASPDLDDRQRHAYNAFLFIIIHRCTSIDRATQEARMRQILDQVKNAWCNEALGNSLSSFQSFCALLGMEHLAEFLSTNRFQQVEDWSEQALPADGQALQANILERSNQLPLRLTKSLLAASIEKLRDGSTAYELAAALWAEAIPVILPNILQLVSHAQAFNNVEDSWSSLPPELQQVIQRMLTDRFWQAGISTESREDFFARVSSSKSTYEGFASTVRGTIRQIRESSYYILYSLTRFPDFFYGITDLPGPLSQALYANASALSAHHLSVLLSISTHLIEGCPPQHRAHFLPPVVEGLFRVLRDKISSQWEAVNQQVAEAGENDNLADEMKTESILRQLTYSSVCLGTAFLDSADRSHHHSQDSEHDHPEDIPLHQFILSTPSVLEPVLLFCNAMLRCRDTRSITTLVPVLRHILTTHFSTPSPIRDFFCNDILKNAITSLHDPYFVDCQKDLASLIAAILTLDDETPRAILLSLPGLGDAGRVDRRLAKLRSSKRDVRLQRSVVLDLLSSLRGVSIHELGKVERMRPKKKSAFQEQYMEMNVEAQPSIVRGGSPGLEGVAGMFDEE
ncbi:ARM repeat-containing protein [Sporormia fimetaria CBS 119925]|uniref:ARM repeat-containing protein n=1 Tax=Sporormia fimetaria CBS 119925 TaxID=1340428 RepID=A0A6A6VRH7_9PLEO|nr:ARM repeat-containing protein [Sporormia fimetaria CBS 119925]